MEKIIAGNWTVPPGVAVSEDCSDLLRRLLVADPAQRLTMAQINAHRWFQTNLPGVHLDVLAENDKIVQDTKYDGEDRSGYIIRGL